MGFSASFNEESSIWPPQPLRSLHDHEWLAGAKAQEAKNAAAIERLTKEISKLTLQRVKLDSENRALSLSILACEEHLKKQVQQRPPMIILPTWGKWSVATAILAIARLRDIFRRTSSEADFHGDKETIRYWR